MRSTNSSGLRLTKLRKKYLAEYIHLTRDEITESDWQYKLWKFMHERDHNIAQEDVKRWIAAHKYMLVPDRDEIVDEGVVNNPAMYEKPKRQQGQVQTNPDYEQHRNCTLPMNSAVSISTGTGLRILNTYQLVPAPAPAPAPSLRDLAHAGTNNGPSPSSCTAKDKASYSPSIAASTVKGGDLLDSQSRDMKGTKNVYQSVFEAIKMIHDACMKLPEVKTCLIPLEEISKIFHRNHHKLIFPVRYEGARNANSRVKVEAFASNDVYHYHSMEDAGEEIQDVEYLCILPA